MNDDYPIEPYNPQEENEALRAASVDPVVSVRTFEHMGHTRKIAFLELSDKEMAGKVRMLTTSDWKDHEAVVCGARDRILALAKEKQRFASLLLAAKHLILAAEGPEGGPTNWNDTRDDWLRLIEKDGINTKSFINQQSH